MSFNPNSKSQKSPLVINNTKESMETLQKKYLNFNKIFEKMQEYDVKLNGFSRSEYDNIQEEVHENIHKLPNLLNEIFTIIRLIESEDSADKRSKDQCSNLIEKLKNKQTEVSSLIKQICDKETIVLKKLSRIDSDQINLAVKNFQENNLQSESSFPLEENRRHSLMGFRESKIFLKDIVNQEDYLNKRTKELEDIKKVANQIKDISTSMKIELEVQGEKVYKINENVEEAKDNVMKAEVEIKEADKISQSSTGNFRCLFFLILILFIGLVLFFLIKFVF